MAKNFSHIILFIGILALAQRASADELSIKHDLKDFDEIRIENVGIELEVTAGEDFEVIVDGDEVNVRNLKVKVRGDKLVLYREDDDKQLWNRNGNSGLTVHVKMPIFSGLDLRGAVEARIKNVDSDDVMFDLKGAGDIEVEGKCKSLTIDLKGAGDFSAKDLICQTVDVDLKGAGDIDVYASEEANVEIKGVGEIDVYGHPKKVSKDDGFLSSITIH